MKRKALNELEQRKDMNVVQASVIKPDDYKAKFDDCLNALGIQSNDAEKEITVQQEKLD